MKKFLDILSVFTAVLITCGSIAKVNHYPFANLALIMGMGSLFYCIILVAFNLSKDKKPSSPLILVAGFAIAIYMVGLLFMLMHWGGGILFIFSGSIVALLALFATILTEFAQKPENRKIPVTALSFVIIALSLLYAASYRTSSPWVINSFVATNRSFEKAIVSLEHFAYIGDDSTPVIADLRDKSDSLVKQLEKLKRELARFGGGSLDDDAEIPMKDNMDISTRMMIEGGKARELKQAIKNYDDFLLDRDNIYHVKMEVGWLLSINNPGGSENGMPITWEMSKFKNVPLIAAIANLSAIEFGVRNCEMTALQRIKK